MFLRGSKFILITILSLIGIFSWSTPLANPLKNKISKKVKRPPQYVVMSFDGAGNMKGWADTLAFSKKQRIFFTYFLTGTFFLHYSKRRLYKPPKLYAGANALSWYKSYDEIIKRIKYANIAIKRGHDLGSHANGHFNANEKKWKYKHWISEFKEFDKLVFNPYKNNKIKKKSTHPTLKLKKSDIIGIRCPHLARGRGLFRALLQSGYRYDASGLTTNPNKWPVKRQGIWDFPMVKINMSPTKMYTYSMDWFFYVRQKRKPISKGKLHIKLMHRLYEEQFYQSMLTYFKNNYNGNRAPVHIGLHYFIDGRLLYWRGIKQFAEKICKLPEVKCLSYKHLVTFLELKKTQEIKEYQKGSFTKSKPISFKYLLGDIPGAKWNFTARVHGPRNYSFCPGLYMGESNKLMRFACYSKKKPQEIKKKVIKLKWKIKLWKESSDKNTISFSATQKNRKIDVIFKRNFLSGGFSGYSIKLSKIK
jgi:hypothetical protein